MVIKFMASCTITTCLDWKHPLVVLCSTKLAACLWVPAHQSFHLLGSIPITYCSGNMVSTKYSSWYNGILLKCRSNVGLWPGKWSKYKPEENDV